MFKFAQHGQTRHVGQRTAAAHRRRSSTTSRSSSRCNTEAINHDPAITYIQTGHQQPGRPSLGAWLSYGLGSENQNLPAFVVMISQGSGNKTDQPIFSRLWGSGFLPTQHQGVRFRTGARPGALPLQPAGHRRRDAAARMLDGVGAAQPHGGRGVRRPGDQHPHRPVRDGLPHAGVSVPELTDLSGESKQTLDMYGLDDDGDDGGFARNCLLARRMAERGVRFVQLMHRGWDQHGNLPKQIRGQCKDVDQPVRRADQGPQAARPARRHARHLGRRVRPHRLQPGRADRGQLRPRPPRPLLHASGWPAAASSRASVYGETDDYCYNIVEGPRPHPRLQRHHPALPGHRPRAADLPVPGPRLPPDRRARERGEGPAGVGVNCRAEAAERRQNVAQGASPEEHALGATKAPEGRRISPPLRGCFLPGPASPTACAVGCILRRSAAGLPPVNPLP